MSQSHTRRSRPRIRLTLAAAAVITLVGAITGQAAQARPLTGTQIDLLDPPATFAAGTPFFVNHGLCGETAEERAGLLRPTSRFELAVDGQSVRTSLYLEASAKRIDNADFSLCKQFIANFREGLPAGNHQIVGCWYYLGQDLFGCETIEIKFD